MSNEDTSDGQEVLKRLMRVNANNDRWNGTERPTGRIADVKIADTDLEDIRSRVESLEVSLHDSIPRSMMFNAPTHHAWLETAETVEYVTEEVDALSEVDVFIVVELPDGTEFVHGFELPTTSDGLFYRFCEALGVDMGLRTEVRDAGLTGKVVPVVHNRGRWWIDLPELTSSPP